MGHEREVLLRRESLEHADRLGGAVEALKAAGRAKMRLEHERCDPAAKQDRRIDSQPARAAVGRPDGWAQLDGSVIAAEGCGAVTAESKPLGLEQLMTHGPDRLGQG